MKLLLILFLLLGVFLTGCAGYKTQEAYFNMPCSHNISCDSYDRQSECDHICDTSGIRIYNYKHKNDVSYDDGKFICHCFQSYKCLNQVLELIKEGALPKPTIKKILAKAKGEGNPLKVLARIRAEIPRDSEFFQSTFVSYSGNINGPKEVILSEMLIKHGQE